MFRKRSAKEKVAALVDRRHLSQPSFMQSIKPLFIVLAVAVLCSGAHGHAGHAGSSAHGSAGDTGVFPRLSEKALVGREIFFDPRLSSSGKLSCASCHSAANAYGPPNALAVQLGGRTLHTAGLRAVPSLRYTLARTPIWAHPQPTSLAERITEKDNYPQGGFAWDGRFNTLHEQAVFPLLATTEMASSKGRVVRRIEGGPYAERFREAFGKDSFASTDEAFAFALLALERFELEDPSFHPYSSKYDRYLDGKATLTAQEQRGLSLFNDGDRGNCASCHLSAPGADGSHPLFTDFQFEAIGVPRNREIPANRDSKFYDMGLCGPIRTNQRDPSYCGMFKTPTLRNVATRQVFFHNGRFHTLKEALRFYVERDTNPGEWYPRGRDQGANAFDDLPVGLRPNVDKITLPFSGSKSKGPVWNDGEIDDVIAFLKTLSDEDQAPNHR
jgi:cytochrome c peroxidase